MEEIYNAGQARSLFLIEAANEFSKLEAAAVAPSLRDASSHLRKARRIIFEALYVCNSTYSLLVKLPFLCQIRYSAYFLTLHGVALNRVPPCILSNFVS